MAKLNWIAWCPADMEANANWRRMTFEERGLFMTCLNLQWVNGSLPSDMGELARLLHINRNKLEKLWRGMVGAMFEYMPGTPYSTQGGRYSNQSLVLYRQLLEKKQKPPFELKESTSTKTPTLPHHTIPNHTSPTKPNQTPEHLKSFDTVVVPNGKAKYSNEEIEKILLIAKRQGWNREETNAFIGRGKPQ